MASMTHPLPPASPFRAPQTAQPRFIPLNTFSGETAAPPDFVPPQAPASTPYAPAGALTQPCLNTPWVRSTAGAVVGGLAGVILSVSTAAGVSQLLGNDISTRDGLLWNDTLTYNGLIASPYVGCAIALATFTGMTLGVIEAGSTPRKYKIAAAVGSAAGILVGAVAAGGISANQHELYGAFLPEYLWPLFMGTAMGAAAFYTPPVVNRVNSAV